MVLVALFVVFYLMWQAQNLNQSLSGSYFGARVFFSLVLLVASYGLLFAVESGQSLLSASPCISELRR